MPRDRPDLVSAFSGASGKDSGPNNGVAIPGMADREGNGSPDLD